MAKTKESMAKLVIRAKVKETGGFIEHIINVDDEIYKINNDTLYGVVSDILDERYGDVFKWFRFWILP